MCLNLLPTWALAEELEAELTVETFADSQSLADEPEGTAEIFEAEPEIDDRIQDSGSGEDGGAVDDDRNEPDGAGGEEPDADNQEDTDVVYDAVPEETGYQGNVNDGTEAGTATEITAALTTASAEETPVTVIFRVTPEDAVITVYTRDNQAEPDEKTEIKPEEDGSYLLLPGKYCYSVMLNGEDIGTEEAELIITNDNYPEYHIDIDLEKASLIADDL